MLQQWKKQSETYRVLRSPQTFSSPSYRWSRHRYKRRICLRRRWTPPRSRSRPSATRTQDNRISQVTTNEKLDCGPVQGPAGCSYSSKVTDLVRHQVTPKNTHDLFLRARRIYRIRQQINIWDGGMLETPAQLQGPAEATLWSSGLFFLLLLAANVELTSYFLIKSCLIGVLSVVSLTFFLLYKK